MKTKPETEDNQSSIIDLYESQINPVILSTFKSTYLVNHSWQGEERYSELYNLWKSIKQRLNNENYSNDIYEDMNDEGPNEDLYVFDFPEFFPKENNSSDFKNDALNFDFQVPDADTSKRSINIIQDIIITPGSLSIDKEISKNDYQNIDIKIGRDGADTLLKDDKIRAVAMRNIQADVPDEVDSTALVIDKGNNHTSRTDDDINPNKHNNTEVMENHYITAEGIDVANDHAGDKNNQGGGDENQYRKEVRTLKKRTVSQVLKDVIRWPEQETSDNSNIKRKKNVNFRPWSHRRNGLK